MNEIWRNLRTLADGKSLTWNLALLTDGIRAEDQIGFLTAEVKDPAKIRVFVDHDTPSGTVATAARQKLMKHFAVKHEISYAYGKGIAYHLLLEEGLKPGTIVIGCGEHVSTVGAEGIIGIHISPEEMKAALENDTVSVEGTEIVELELNGQFSCFTAAKDLAFSIREKDSFRDRFLVIHGPQLSFTERVTVCNLLSAYCRGVVFENETISPNESLCLEDLQPLALEPGNDNPIPAGRSDGIRVNQVFIGGCCGGTIESLRTAAEIWQGRQVSPYVRVMVAPATAEVYEQAIREGLVETFLSANVLIMNAGCSACWAQSQGRCSEGEVFATTGSFNCAGWCGANNNGIHIVSAETAARAALSGTINEY